MDQQELNRRDFHRLTMAAFGGALAGTMAGCGEENKPAAGGGAGKSEPHGCRGLNACKNQGANGKNDCAGQGTCATKEWHHSCHAANACKGQGGCGDSPLQNECKGKGECSIPLMGPAWETARKHFLEQMEKEGKKVGEAPPKAKAG